MEREKFKLDEIVRNKKELLKIIEEKEIQIEDQKLKLQLANEEIEKIKIELKELKKDISASIIERVDNQLEEKKSNTFRRINEKENNISIELVEVEENKQIYGNEPIDKEKQNTNEILAEELVVNSIEDKEKAEDKLILIENLKLVFIENNNYKSIEILNEILGNIKFIENNITDEEKILLLYLGYFYNKLEELLKKSEVINEFYYSDINEIKLLIMLIEEKEYSIYQQVKETVLMKIIDNKKLFNGLDTILRVRIIDKIKNVSYKVFDVVYSIKDIKQGQESITLKAWVKERDKENYKLVEGLYCKDTEKLYMLESSIYILGLNIKYLMDDESQTQNIQKIEDLSDNKQEKNNKVNNLKEKYEKNDEYYIDDEDDSNIWTRLKGKFRLKLKK